MRSKSGLSRASLCTITWIAILLTTASAHAQTLPVGPTPEIALAVNNSFTPTVYQGWPLVFEMEIYSPNVAQRNGNAVPITLNLPSGSWSDGVQLAVLDSSGNMQTWPTHLVYHPAGAAGSIVLSAGIEGRLAWTVAPSSTSSIAAGTYQAVALLNATSTTVTGAFNGAAGSNPVTITIGSEPSPLPVNLQEDKYTLLAVYDVLEGNQTQAATDLSTLLTNQPNSIVAMTAMGDLLNLQGNSSAALQQYDKAVAAFVAAFPTAIEPPSGLIDRQASVRAGMASQSGAISPPLVGATITNQGVQSPGIYSFDLLLKNSGTGTAELPELSQLSYLTVAGTGQATYDTTLSPPIPVGTDSLTPGASTTLRIYLDVPATVTQFTIDFSGTAQDIVGTIYNFSGTQTVTPSSIVTTGSPLTITAGNATQQYGRATPNLNNVTYSGFVNGDTPGSLTGTLNCATTATQASPVGTYPITCSGLSSSNYTITYAAGTLTITAAPLTVTANNASVQYGQPIALSGTSYSGFVNGDTAASLGGTLNCTTTATPSSPAGTYPITCAGLTSPNYTISFPQGTLMVTAAPLTITANNVARAYGAANPPLNNVMTSNFVNGNSLASLNGTLICTTSANSTSPPGAYAIACSGLSSPNYAISYIPGTLTVSADLLTITANNATRAYGAANPPLNRVTYNGFANGDTASALTGTLICTTTATASSPAGPYPISCSGLSSTNYTITYVPGQLTITSPTCASNVTASVAVTRSGFSYSPLSKRYAQTLTLTNTAGSMITGPIYVILDNLTTSAALYNTGGSTACAAPTGSPYVSIAGPIGAGASTNVVLQFTDPTNAAISYTPRFLAGSGQP
jgi:hypothetical protein